MLKTKDDAPGLERRSVTSALWSAVGGYGNVFLSFAVFLILARLLTPDEFGLVAIATVFVDIILVIARGGLPEAVLQRPQLEEDYADTAFWFSLAWGGALCALLAAAAPLLAVLFGLAELGPVLMALSAVLFIMGAGSIHEARLQREFAFRKLAMRAIFSNMAAGAIAIILALQGWGVWAMVAQRLIASIVTTVLNWLASGWVPRRRFLRHYAADQWRFGSRIFSASFLLAMNLRLQELIAAMFLTPAAVGYIRLCWRCIDLVSQFAVIPFGSVAMATYSQAHAQKGSVEEACLGFIRFSGLLAFPCFAGMAAVAPLFIPVLFGENWKPAVPVLQILCLIAIPFVVESFTWGVLAAIKRPELNLKISILQLLAGIGLSFLAAPFGLYPVAWAHVAKVYGVWPLGIVYTQRHGGVEFGKIIKVVAIPLGASIIMGASVCVAGLMIDGHWPPAVSLAALVAMGVCVYAALIYAGMPTVARTCVGELRKILSRG
ncbi:lipopolysaccharide biosynthesis protein [Agrobacterium sp. NPDC089420]|uniref:lipopolysaccharide biosynthesis protein n=1 Tax=Agrobacterium sp. NPDC089420 TaxID=3363918 RepID=UPI00384CF1E6